jgi:hypothetical protein
VLPTVYGLCKKNIIFAGLELAEMMLPRVMQI